MLKSFLLVTSSAIAGLGALFGAGAGNPDQAQDGVYSETAHAIYQNQFLDHSETLFERADMDNSGALDVDEYSALMVVQTELSRLNGFIALQMDSHVTTIPISNPDGKVGLSHGDRTRIDAVARAHFYSAAGLDNQLSWDEYAMTAINVFASVDRNQDGVLRGRELNAFADQAAFVMTNNA